MDNPSDHLPPAPRRDWPFLIGWLLALTLVSIWACSENTSRRRAQQGTRVGPTDAYNPVTAGERLPDTFRQLLPHDAIRPVYDPTFVAATDAGWSGDTDIIGVAGGGEAKAYPVTSFPGDFPTFWPDGTVWPP